MNMVIACTGQGRENMYAGTATDLGYLIGNTVYNSLTSGIETYLETKGKPVYCK
ncbi:hypothetical protein RDV78_02500 [Bacillota bacterium LX-D]|nr:hypothetical protein [Bacillota bacterium LX-D]